MKDKLKTASLWIIVLCVVIWALQFIAFKFGIMQDLTYNLALSWEGIKEMKYWQFVTNIFSHHPTNVIHIMFNMIGVWYLGMALENVIGWRKYLMFMIVCGVIANASWLLFNPAGWLVGLSGAVYGLFGGIIALDYKNKIDVFGAFKLDAYVLGLMIVGYEVVSILLRISMGVANSVHIVGLIIGFLLIKFIWKKPTNEKN